MSLEIHYTECKIIHWEYHKEMSSSITDVETYFKALPIVKPGTQIEYGILFKHVLKLHVVGNTKLHCLGEQAFFGDTFKSWGFIEVEDIIKGTINSFNKLYEHKYFEATGLHGSSIIHNLKIEDVQTVLRIVHSE